MAMDKEMKAEIVTAKLNHLTAWLGQQNDLESLLKRVKAEGRLQLRKEFKALRDRQFYDSLFSE